MLTPARELISTLRLQSNASVTTRSKLEFLIELTGGVWQELRSVREQVARIASGGAR